MQTLTEFFNYLKENKAFELILGISSTEFDTLLKKFSAKKLQDRTTKLKENNEKLIALLLIKRFALTDHETRALFLSNCSTTVLKTFNKTVSPRLDAAAQSLADPLKTKTLNIAPIKRSSWTDQSYINLAELINAAVHAHQASYVFITHKFRESTPEWITTYLAKPVQQKNKTGQANFLQLMQCALFDLENFPSPQNYIVWYLALSLNLFLHNSSHKSFGNDKVQDTESEHVNYYFRSQADHPYLGFFKKIMTTDARKQCLGMLNQPLMRLITLNDNKVTRGVHKYDNCGRPITSDNDGYFNTTIGHTGLRQNNLIQYITAIDAYINFTSIDGFVKKLIEKEIIPKNFTQRIVMCDPITLERRIDFLGKQFTQLQDECEKLQPVQATQQQSLSTRQARAQKIHTQCTAKNFKNIRMNFAPNSTCLYFQFYADTYVSQKGNIANYEEGVTNIIIGFFGGLLNHYCEVNSFFINTQRRQSFGFLRPTLTDAGNLIMRLSLGLEPEIFDEVVLNALETLDDLLTQFDFINPTDETVKQGFEVVETKGGGNRFRKAMRSANKCIATIPCAHDCLNEFSGEPHKAFKKYISTIMSDSFQEQTLVTTPITQNETIIDNPDTTSKPNTYLNILQNVLLYTFKIINETNLQLDNSFFKYSYWHLLTKLYKYAKKAQAILKNADDCQTTHIYAKATQLIENILEYLIPLQALKFIQNKANNAQPNHVQILIDQEKRYAKQKLNLTDQNIHVFFSDSGQQAFTTSLLVMIMHLAQNNLPEALFIHKKCYYELSMSIKDDLEKPLCKDITQAKMVFIDITGLNDQLSNVETYTNAEVVIIDITHDPSLINTTIQTLVNNLLAQNKIVLLLSSMLKHEQLGLDKYQAGKTIVLTPQNNDLTDNIIDEFKQVSESAMHPLAAAFFVMINTICQDKITHDATPQHHVNNAIALRPK